ncbi:MAG TPA: cytochrome C oxidase subunit IV family protein [Candidatus Binatia bacterium]
MSAKATTHGSGVKHEGVDKSSEVRTYLIIFGCLAVLTLMTVGVAYMNLPHAAGVVIALVIAAAKVFLIAAFFMHLRGEGKLINWSVAVCLALVLILIVFVLPDIGIHPLEDAARRAAHELEAVSHGHYPASAPAGASAH